MPRRIRAQGESRYFLKASTELTLQAHSRFNHKNHCMGPTEWNCAQAA